MIRSLRTPLLLACLAVGPLAIAQDAGRRGAWCATDEQAALLRTTFHDPALARERAAADAQSDLLQRDDASAARARPTATRFVPVVIHVVSTCGEQSITDAQILDGMRILNEDWSRLSADTVQTRPIFKQRAADLNVEFRLAKLDPQGQPTTGIVRVTNIATNSASDRIKAVVPAWNNYFNIWLVNSIGTGGGGGTILGYAQFPGTGPWNTWGVVQRVDTWIAPVGQGRDRTMSHEIGHCFDLAHTFQSGCGASCTSSGDGVCDTPPSSAATYGCNQTQNTCANDANGPSPYTGNVVDQIENYMSYDDCQNMFSLGQQLRVEAAINSFSYLRNMMSPANLLATGITTGQVVGAPAPIPYFASCNTRVCEGGSLTFADGSYNGRVASRTWTFTGATVASDTARNPIVTFTTPGLQTVTLSVNDGVNPPRPSLTAQVMVSTTTSGYQAPFQFAFPASQFPTDATDPFRNWEITSQGSTGAGWEATSLAGTPNDNESVRIRLRNATARSTHFLYSPNIVVPSALNRAYLSFRRAYAPATAAAADILKVDYSLDCGRTWTNRATRASAQLRTANAVAGIFVPTATQWAADSIPLPTTLAAGAHLQVRFSVAVDGGNALYLDALRIRGRVLSTAADQAAGAEVSLAPNPLTDETRVALTLTRPTRVALYVTDVLGRVVLTQAERSLPAGAHLLPIAEGLRRATAGVYAVTVLLDGQPLTQRLSVQ